MADAKQRKPTPLSQQLAGYGIWQQISGGAEEVIPLYCKLDDNAIPHSWAQVMKESIKNIGPNFCSGRIGKEYGKTVSPKRYELRFEIGSFRFIQKE